jgi:DNA invertase Pin-like site-specific DNA recombinase
VYKPQSQLIQAIREVREQLYASIKEQLKDETRTYKEIAEANGISMATVQRVAERCGISRPVGPRPYKRLEHDHGAENISSGNNNKGKHTAKHLEVQ